MGEGEKAHRLALSQEVFPVQGDPPPMPIFRTCENKEENGRHMEKERNKDLSVVTMSSNKETTQLAQTTTTLELSPYVQANKDAQELLPKFPATGIEPVANRYLLQGRHRLQSVALPSELCQKVMHSVMHPRSI